MDWRPQGYKLTTPHLVRAIFDGNSDEAALINNAAHGRVELFASPNSWNAVLWLIMSTLKVDGNPIYSGMELKTLKESLPIVWRD